MSIFSIPNVLIHTAFKVIFPGFMGYAWPISNLDQNPVKAIRAISNRYVILMPSNYGSCKKSFTPKHSCSMCKSNNWKMKANSMQFKRRTFCQIHCVFQIHVCRTGQILPVLLAHHLFLCLLVRHGLFLCHSQVCQFCPYWLTNDFYSFVRHACMLPPGTDKLLINESTLTMESNFNHPIFHALFQNVN